MSRLTRGMYGDQFSGFVGLFGLHCGQIKDAGRVARNATWYNKTGDRLGFGDLDKTNLERIARELKPGELFILLTETDGFDKFVFHRGGVIGADAATSSDIEAPGATYIAEWSYFVIAPGKIYVVKDDYKDGEQFNVHGLICEILTREAAKKLILS